MSAPAFNRAAERYEIVKTWANWDSVKEEVLAVVYGHDAAAQNARALHEQFQPWAACYARFAP